VYTVRPPTALPPTVLTFTRPAVGNGGAVTVSRPASAAVTGARLPLTLTVLRTGSGSNRLPSTVNDPPRATTTGPIPSTVGGAGPVSTAKGTLDDAPPRETRNSPLDAPTGTVTTTWFGATERIGASVPPMDTLSEEVEAPNPVPRTSTSAPAGARLGDTATTCSSSAARRRTSVTFPLGSYTYSAPAPDASNTPVSRPAGSRANDAPVVGAAAVISGAPVDDGPDPGGPADPGDPAVGAVPGADAVRAAAPDGGTPATISNTEDEMMSRVRIRMAPHDKVHAGTGMRAEP
jgi:hypothetical protein